MFTTKRRTNSCAGILMVWMILIGGYKAGAAEITLKIEKQFLNFPIAQKNDRMKMTFQAEGLPEWSVVARLATGKIDYWTFYDVSHLIGKSLTIMYDGDMTALKQIYQADQIENGATLYEEDTRPQFHFSTKRGWINDPNGLVYYDGEYHLFYQHNPMEREWENMHWGHAVSQDLVHWKELPTALYPDEHGTMFSGSAIIDYENVAGFSQDGKPAMLAFYTAASSDRQVQCLAYSVDNGRIWSKYGENPIIDSKEKWNSVDTRDPKVFWYASSGHWVMVLNERDGHSIYTSTDLKKWEYKSHVTGFWECPELFELAIDGDEDNTKWVMYGASGTYMLGDFDGEVFTPESGKYFYTTGTMYAAQTFSNIPDSDGRRIQIGWGRVSHGDVAFNGQMMLPTVLTLRMTKEGPRLFNNPVAELEKLMSKQDRWQDLTSSRANEMLQKYKDRDCLRLRTKIKLSHATSAGLNLFGQRIIDYDMNWNTINGRFYSPQDPASMELSADIYIDRTSIEVFIDGGIYSYSIERKPASNNREGLHFWGNNITVTNLEVFHVSSIWK